MKNLKRERLQSFARSICVHYEKQAVALLSGQFPSFVSSDKSTTCRALSPVSDASGIASELPSAVSLSSVT